MKIKKILMFAALSLRIFSHADFSAQDLMEMSAQKVDVLKKISDANEAWIAEKSGLEARLSAMEALNKRIKKEIEEAKAQNEKSHVQASEILASLEKFKNFEADLEKSLRESEKKFLEKSQTPPAVYALKSLLAPDENYKDVYSFAEAAVEARIFALKCSRELSVRSVEGEYAVFIGLCAALKKSEFDGVSEIADILRGKSAHKIVSVERERK